MLGKGKSGGNAEAASRVQSARIIPHLPDGPRQLTDAFIDVVADHMANGADRSEQLSLRPAVFDLHEIHLETLELAGVVVRKDPTWAIGLHELYVVPERYRDICHNASEARRVLEPLIEENWRECVGNEDPFLPERQPPPPDVKKQKLGAVSAAVQGGGAEELEQVEADELLGQVAELQLGGAGEPHSGLAAPNQDEAMHASEATPIHANEFCEVEVVFGELWMIFGNEFVEGQGPQAEQETWLGEAFLSVMPHLYNWRCPTLSELAGVVAEGQTDDPLAAALDDIEEKVPALRAVSPALARLVLARN